MEDISLSVLFHLLQWMPPVRSLQRERDTLRGEQNSMQLKLRAASAEMGVLEEQCRVLQAECDRLRKRATQTANYERQAARLRIAMDAGQDLARERDTLAAEHASLVEQRDAVVAERDRLARVIERQCAPTEPNGPPSPRGKVSDRPDASPQEEISAADAS